MLSGPEDVTLNYNYSPNGVYQQSVTLTARMWPPIEAGSPKVVWGLPVVVWCIVFGCLLVVILILVALLLCCWLLPKRRKVLSPTRYDAQPGAPPPPVGASGAAGAIPIAGIYLYIYTFYLFTNA